MDYEKYTPGQQVLEALQAVERQKGKKPGEYVSPWTDALNTVLGQIRDREDFHYDPAGDVLYRQAVDRYVRLGRQAMMDTLGQASALTGGYANSYAQTAGQQSYQKYLLGLAARLPQFQQMALDRYQAAGKQLMDRYQVISQQEKTGHDRYQQALDRYYGELQRLQGIYDTQRDRDYRTFVEERAFAYGKQQDAAEAARREEEARQQQIRFEQQQAYQAERDRIRDQQWQKDFDESRRRHDLQLQLRQAEAAARAAAAAHRGGGSRGSGSRGTGTGTRQESVSSGPLNRFSRDTYYAWKDSVKKSAAGRGRPGNMRNEWY